MTCTGCSAEVPGGARFCPACGAGVPVEDPVAVATYRDALAKLGGRAEAWARAELAELREELSIRPDTHERLLAELAPAAAEAPIGVWIDARPVADFRAGEQCVLRLRVQNRSARSVAALGLRVEVTAADQPLEVRSEQVLGPGDEDVLSVWFRPAVAGHHRVDAVIEVAPIRGAPSRWACEAIPFLIGAAAALQQQITIDASTQRVGVFENIGAASKGGLIADADWRPVPVRGAAAEVRPEGAQTPLPAGGVAVVVTGGDPPVVALDGVRGDLVELHDPGLRGRLGHGDRLQVSVIGRDVAGRPLYSSRPAQAPTARPGGVISVGPDDDLAEAVRGAPAGARIEVRGEHQGPLVLDRAVSLTGVDGATITSPTGPVLRIDGDVVLCELTVRGAAPAGQYAVDAIEARSGRVVVERCVVSADAPGNLVPGRAVVVAGAANVELRACQVQGSGVGVAVDVSWSGFATDLARGARVRLVGCELVGVGIGVAVAGADREVRVVKTRFAGIGEAAVRVLGSATCSIEGCAVPKRLLVADTGANLIVKA
jgi:hypothetical protein